MSKKIDVQKYLFILKKFNTIKLCNNEQWFDHVAIATAAAAAAAAAVVISQLDSVIIDFDDDDDDDDFVLICVGWQCCTNIIVSILLLAVVVGFIIKEYYFFAELFFQLERKQKTRGRKVKNKIKFLRKKIRIFLFHIIQYRCKKMK